MGIRDLIYFYPDSFKLTWLAAIHTVFPLKQNSNAFRLLRNNSIYLSDDVPSLPGLVGEIDPRYHFYDREATSFNLSKLLYTMDYFSFKLCVAKMKDTTPVVESPEGECKKITMLKLIP